MRGRRTERSDAVVDTAGRRSCRNDLTHTWKASAYGVAILTVLTDAARSASAAGDPRSQGQVMADTLTARACGLASPDDTPVEVQLLMTDMTLLGGEEETAWTDGHPLPGHVARDLAPGVPGTPPLPGEPPPDIGRAARWIHRLYTDARPGELTGVDTGRRLFRGTDRRFILLRDQRCRTPWCDAAIHDVDHAHRYADGGSTDADNGIGHCKRFNLAKEVLGWVSTVEPAAEGRPSRLIMRTPTGHVYESTAPVLRRLLEGPVGERSELISEEPLGPDGAPAAPEVDRSPDADHLPGSRTG